MLPAAKLQGFIRFNQTLIVLTDVDWGRVVRELMKAMEK